ncbi:MAG TPA: hypothetical protein VKF60_05225 [Myxococcota bacterium]|nr:hypothetical protein [Myxococcota bacterium]
MKKVLSYTAIAAAILVVLLIATMLVAQRVSDGPIGPLGGGPLRTGALVTESNVDWSFLGGGKEIELQLVAPPRSRITGSLVHDGQLFVPCDLGFFWRRIPNAGLRWIGGVIYSVKRWHEDALRDGRVVLRVAGKRYERQAVRVTDPELLATLRSIFEERAKQYLGTGALLDVPADPDAIWFFRMDPRPVALNATP